MISTSATFISAITKKRAPCIFLSPHLDDAAFSAGDLLLSLQSQGVQCIVVTFFTDAHSKPPTLSARMFLHQSKNSSAPTLFANRKKEDASIFANHSIHSIHVGLLDGMWRLKPTPTLFERFSAVLLPEFIHLYPTYRFHIRHGFTHQADPAPKQLRSTLQNLSKHYPDALFFAPIATGTHTDHILVRNAVVDSKLPAIFWNDYPYSLSAQVNTDFTSRLQLKPLVFSNSWDKKRQLILEYETQVSAIFPNGVPTSGEEIYYLPPHIQSLLSGHVR